MSRVVDLLPRRGILKDPTPTSAIMPLQAPMVQSVEFWRREGQLLIDLPGIKKHQEAQEMFLGMEESGTLPFSHKGYMGWLGADHDNSQHAATGGELVLFIPLMPDEARGKMRYILNRTVVCWRSIALAQGRRDLLPERTVGQRLHNHVMLTIDGVELGSCRIGRRSTGDGAYYILASVMAEPLWSNTWPG